jgi:hypothetical protein
VTENCQFFFDWWLQGLDTSTKREKASERSVLKQDFWAAQNRPFAIPHCIDFSAPAFNNPLMARPDAVRRIKTYSAADGYVYQYYFYEGNRANRGGDPGGEFVYMISADRQSAFPFKIFVRQSALEAWAEQNGRSLTSSEEYAVAKMRLFLAFDEGSVQPPPAGLQPGEVRVDESNLEDLLRQLGI